VFVGADTTRITADLTTLAKYHARKLEGLGRVRDSSDPGYALFEAHARVRRCHLSPLLVDPGG
jgi:hypothetical protein